MLSIKKKFKFNFKKFIFIKCIFNQSKNKKKYTNEVFNKTNILII